METRIYAFDFWDFASASGDRKDACPALAGTIQLKVVEESASKVEQASCLFIGSEGKRTEEFMVPSVQKAPRANRTRVRQDA